MASTSNEVGACLLLLDFPAGHEIGIDFKYWKTGARFKGIKGIPPGIHLIYSSAVDVCGQVGFRTGFFAKFDPDSIVVKQWNSKDEWFDDGPSTEADLQRYRDNMAEIATFLGPYPAELYPKWVAQSSHLTQPLLTRVVPNNRIDCVPDYTSPASNTAQRREQAARGDEQKEVQPETNLHFSPVELRAVPIGCGPAEVSRHMMDKSFALGALIDGYGNLETDTATPDLLVLGELQLAFLAFLLCNDYSAFEQWKRLMTLLCRCEVALSERPALYEALVSVLYHQLSEAPPELFADIVTRENCVVDALQQLFVAVDANEACPASLRKRIGGFRQHLLQRFGWEFEEESEEDRPVIVDCS